MQAEDASTIAQIWFQGLSQTSDANWFFLRPLLRFKMEQYGQESLSEMGDMGPEGNKLIEIWSRNDRVMLVAYQKDAPDHIVGMVGVKKGDDPLDEQPDAVVASIWKMSVAVSARRQGVGQALMKAAEEHARNVLHCHTMVLMTANPAAGEFYESCHFIRVPPATWYEALHPIRLILRRYAKEL